MPPKKRTHTGASSSRSYDSVKFWNEEAEKLYSLFLARPIVRERGIDYSQRRPDGIDDEISLQGDAIVQRGWVEFVKTPPDAVVPVVREFYSNLKIKHENYKVLVRGKLVSFQARTINQLFGLPGFDDDDYRRYMDEGVNYTDIIQKLCRDGAEWRMHNDTPVTFKKSDLIRDEKKWAEFVVARLMPSSHATDITKEKAVLIYAIVTGKTIDIGKIIHQGIIRIATGPNSIALPFPHLITELCRTAGVGWEHDEQILKARSPIIMNNGRPLRAERQDVTNRIERAEFNARARERRDPLPQPIERLNFGQRLTVVEDSLREHRRDFAEHRHFSNIFMGHVLDFQAVLAQRFPPIGPEDAPFPPPPVWPPHYTVDIPPHQAMDEDDDGDH